MEGANRNDWNQGLQNINYGLLPIQKWAFKTNIKLSLHKALIRSVMTYACPAWELAADTYLLKFQLPHSPKKFSSPLENFQGAHRSTISTRLSTFRIYIIM
jgi:hypothetical protein